jgi:hypothetical protein
LMDCRSGKIGQSLCWVYVESQVKNRATGKLSNIAITGGSFVSLHFLLPVGWMRDSTPAPGETSWVSLGWPRKGQQIG